MHVNGQVQTTPGVIYPDVTVEGKPYKLKFTLASSFLLSQWNIPWGALEDWEKAQRAAGQGMNVVLTLAASMLGSINATGDFEPLGIAPLTLAAKLTSVELVALAQAFNDAMGKVQPAAETPAATPATDPVQ